MTREKYLKFMTKWRPLIRRHLDEAIEINQKFVLDDFDFERMETIRAIMKHLACRFYDRKTITPRELIIFTDIFRDGVR